MIDLGSIITAYFYHIWLVVVQKSGGAYQFQLGCRLLIRGLPKHSTNQDEHN